MRFSILFGTEMHDEKRGLKINVRKIAGSFRFLTSKLQDMNKQVTKNKSFNIAGQIRVLSIHFS